MKARERVVETWRRRASSRARIEIELARSDRSKTRIEPYLSDEWFVAVGDLVKSYGRRARWSRKFTRAYQALPGLAGRETRWCISRQL